MTEHCICCFMRQIVVCPRLCSLRFRLVVRAAAVAGHWPEGWTEAGYMEFLATRCAEPLEMLSALSAFAVGKLSLIVLSHKLFFI